MMQGGPEKVRVICAPDCAKTCTNTLPQAHEQKWQGMKVSLGAPTAHLPCMCFTVGPEWVFQFARTVHEKITSLRSEIKSSYRSRLRGIFSIFFRPPGPCDFPGKVSKIIHTSDFFPMECFRGDTVLVREFRFPVCARKLPGICCQIPLDMLPFRECGEVAETFRQCILSLPFCCCWDWGPGACSGDPPKTLKMTFRLCTSVGVQSLLYHPRKFPGKKKGTYPC